MNHHPNPPPKPSLRKPAGVALILGLILLVAVLVVGASDHIGSLPIWLQAIIYLIIGTIWIAPLRPLLLWMETGKWRE